MRWESYPFALNKRSCLYCLLGIVASQVLLSKRPIWPVGCKILLPYWLGVLLVYCCFPLWILLPWFCLSNLLIVASWVGLGDALSLDLLLRSLPRSFDLLWYWPITPALLLKSSSWWVVPQVLADLGEALSLDLLCRSLPGTFDLILSFDQDLESFVPLWLALKMHFHLTRSLWVIWPGHFKWFDLVTKFSS